MERNGVLSIILFAYWTGLCTHDALLNVPHMLQSALESGRRQGTAFDRVNHQGIFFKLCSFIIIVITHFYFFFKLPCVVYNIFGGLQLVYPCMCCELAGINCAVCYLEILLGYSCVCEMILFSDCYYILCLVLYFAVLNLRMAKV